MPSNVSNKYTKQTPLSGSSVKAVMAERVYIAPADTVYADPSARLDGDDPGAPWEDLGVVMNSRVNLSYTKDIRYALGKTAECSFTLEQYDIAAMEAVTGLAAGAVGAIGSKVQIGQDDIVEGAFLFVGVNKIDGKEHHIYTKKGVISYNIAQEDDFRVLQCSISLYPFIAAGETDEGFYTWIVLD
jgi:hypothetical protein